MEHFKDCRAKEPQRREIEHSSEQLPEIHQFVAYSTSVYSVFICFYSHRERERSHREKALIETQQ